MSTIDVMALALNGILITADMSGNTTYKQVLPKQTLVVEAKRSIIVPICSMPVDLRVTS